MNNLSYGMPGRPGLRDRHVLPPAPPGRAATIGYAVALMALGVLACLFPLEGSLFAGYALAWALVAGGLAAIYAGVVHIREHGYWADLLLGLLTLLFGVALLILPLAGAVTILWSLSLWFAVAGVIEIGAAFSLKAGRWLQLVNGALDLLLSAFLMFAFASLDVGTVSVLVGLSLILSGVNVMFRTLAPARAMAGA